MTDDTTLAISSVLRATDDYLAFLSTYRHGDDGPAEPSTLTNVPQAVMIGRALHEQPQRVYQAFVDRLSTGLMELPDPLAAALAAINVGIAIESNGVDPASLSEAMRLRLPGDFVAARRFVALVEAETGEKSPRKVDKAILARLGSAERTGASAWAALQFSTPAAMAAWCRHPRGRQVASATPGLAEDAEFLGSRGGECWYIAELLSCADGTRLTVIAPEQRKGFVVELEAVRNAAHLFVLLEDTLVGDADQGLLSGPKADPAVVAIARGEAPLNAANVFSIGWHYEYWWGLSPEGAARARGLHPLVAAMIGVEASARDLPSFQGGPLILMRPRQLGARYCDMSFFAPLHDALRSRATIEARLSPSEVDDLCTALRSEAGKLGST